MSGSREIRSKIQSVKNTQKITRAMEMVAASKMRKAQDRMRIPRPYAEKIRQAIGHLANSHSEYNHLYLSSRPIKRAGYIVISSDRGLCGGLNNNLFKLYVSHAKQHHDQNVGVDHCIIGHRAELFFSRFGGNIIGQAKHLGDKPSLEDLVGIVKVMLDAYIEEKVDVIYLVYNRFINTMKQQPKIEQLLPLETTDDDDLSHHWDYIYEPEAKVILDMLLQRYVESQIFQSVVENNACEQAARMVAMKSATDNAGDIIDELQLVYNKARQAAITKEISEIVGGAEALS